MKRIIIVTTILSLIIISMVTAGTIFIDNANIYLSSTPEKIMQNGWVEFELETKTYTGEINVYWGFNTTNTHPIKAEIWSNQTNGTTNGLWIELTDFQIIEYPLLNSNTWYYLENTPIIATERYKVRIYLEIDEKGEYDFIVHPSSYGLNIEQANNDGYLYYLTSNYQTHKNYVQEYMGLNQINLEELLNEGEQIKTLQQQLPISERDKVWKRVCYYE